MTWLIGQWPQLGLVVAKAALMYVAAVAGLRFAQRRTLAQWTTIDVVAAVAMGAVVGRTAVAGPQSFVIGAAALATLLVAHRVGGLLRLVPGFATLTDHRVRVLVRDGRPETHQLRRCGLTDADVAAHLREKGIFDLADVGLLLYEDKGALTVVPRATAADPPPLVRLALAVDRDHDH